MQPTLARFIGILKASTSTVCRKELSSDESDDEEKQQSEEDCSKSSVRLAQDCKQWRSDRILLNVGQPVTACQLVVWRRPPLCYKSAGRFT